MDWVRLMTLNDLNRARLLKTKLDSFGIPCYISNEHFAGLYGGVFSVDLYVQKEAVQDAVQLLEEKNEMVEGQCPNCGSTQIKENRVIRNSEPMPEEFGEFNPDHLRAYKRYECEQCGEVWIEEEEDGNAV